MSSTVTTQGSSTSTWSGQDRGDGVDDDRLETLARYGFAAKGVLYALVGILAGRLATGGGGSTEASKRGALDLVARQPFGQVLLGLLAAGLAGYALYRLVLVWTGPDHDTSMPDALARTSYLIRGVLYGGLAVVAVQQLLGGGGSSGGGGGQDAGASLTARVLEWSFGVPLVVAAGVIVIVVGLRQLWRAVTTDWDDKLHRYRMSETARRWTTRLGIAGFTGRGIVYGLIGWFLVQAALDYDPSKGAGLDRALHEVAQASYGPYVLWAVAVMLVAYGAFSLAMARFRRL